MPSKSNRDTEPSTDFFRQPEAGSNNGVDHPATPEAEEWEVEALQAAQDTPSASTEDEWDLDALRLTQDFGIGVDGKKLLTVVHVRKPTRQEFVRVHPAWQMGAALLEVKGEKEPYALTGTVQQAHAKDADPVDLVVAVNSVGELFVWPVKRGKGGQNENTWIASAQEGARVAQEYWVRIVSNQESRAYDIIQASAKYPAPEWPKDLTLNDLIKLAFKDRVIRKLDHPVLRRLRGEIV